MENYDYEALAGTIEIAHITADKTNQYILRQLQKNDPDFDKLVVVNSRDDDGDNEYFPEGARILGWVGYYIGKNTKLQGLQLRLNPFQDFLCDKEEFFNREEFFRGVNCNRSIRKIQFHNTDLSGGEIFQSLGQLFEKNGNLSEIEVEECDFGPGCARQLSLALRGCAKSLKCVRFYGNQMGGEQSVEIIEAFSVHPQLEKLELVGMNVGRSECRAILVRLLRADIDLLSLYLSNNAIDDEGVDDLAGALISSRLRILSLSFNRNITDRGCQTLATMLQNPKSSLEELRLFNNSIGDEGAITFANALASNRKLKTLSLGGNGITAEGWSSFSKVLCDNSSINNTFLSNHTLGGLGMLSTSVPADLRSLLALNGSSEDKRQVAMEKILKHHQHFDMQPFFEWDLKFLPLAVNWFERAQSIENNEEVGVGRHKLGAIYQFIRAIPEVFEPAPAAAGQKRKVPS